MSINTDDAAVEIENLRKALASARAELKALTKKNAYDESDMATVWRAVHGEAGAEVLRSGETVGQSIVRVFATMHQAYNGISNANIRALAMEEAARWHDGGVILNAHMLGEDGNPVFADGIKMHKMAAKHFRDAAPLDSSLQVLRKEDVEAVREALAALLIEADERGRAVAPGLRAALAILEKQS